MPPRDRPRYTLAPYATADYGAVLEIFQSNTPDFFAPSELDEFIAFLEAPQSELVVARSAKGEVVGFGAAYCRSASEGGLAWGMVHRRWHRKGVGRLLLEARIARLWAQEVTQIRVHTSQHSAGFFRQAGFAAITVTPDGFGPGIDRVTMLLQRTASAQQHGTHAGRE